MAEKEKRLLPCPFCGGEAGIDKRYAEFYTKVYAVMCRECGASSKHRTKEEDAIKAWNRRAD